MKFLRLWLIVATALSAGCATQSTQDTNANVGTDTKSASQVASPAPAAGPAPDSSITLGTDSSGMKSVPMARSVYYAYDKFDVPPESRKVIEANADYLRTHPGAKVVVQGNADERGSAEYNLALGQRRADSVSKIMELLGINSDRIETVSFGKEKPKVVGHDESAWSQNRRSDIVYK